MTTTTIESNKAAMSSFLSKHYDAIYISTEDEDSGPYAPSSTKTTTTAKTLTTNCIEIPTIVAAPIYTQYPQSALSARIRQFTRGQYPPGCKRDSGGSELSVRFADQLVTTHTRKKHRVDFKSTASEGGDFFDGKSSIAKTTVSCPPTTTTAQIAATINNTEKFDYKAYVNYIVKVRD